MSPIAFENMNPTIVEHREGQWSTSTTEKH